MKLESLPKLVMFDLDGTLADTVPQLHEAVLAALRKVGKNPITIEQTRSYVGNGAMLLIARAIARTQEVRLEDLDRDLLAFARNEFNLVYSNCFDCSKSIYPKVLETLSYLKSKCVKLAVVSNKPNRFIVPILEKAGLLKYFDETLGSEVIPETKPNAAPLIYVCQKIGVSTNDAVMVGDSYNDILAARNASITSIGLTYGYNRGLDIRDSSPDYVFDDFCSVYNLFKSFDV